MDRDQVNCLHDLYQGDPARRLTYQMLSGTPRLVWCGNDTIAPLVNSQILSRDGDAVMTPDWCVSFIDEVENQHRSLPQPDFVFGYPFSAPIRKPGQRRPAFVAISYAPHFGDVKDVILEAGAAANFNCEVTPSCAYWSSLTSMPSARRLSASSIGRGSGTRTRCPFCSASIQP